MEKEKKELERRKRFEREKKEIELENRFPIIGQFIQEKNFKNI